MTVDPTRRLDVSHIRPVGPVPPVNPDRLVSLDRNLPVPGIDYSPDCAYRMIGEPGFADFQASGHIRANQDRGKYADTYLTVGLASSRYRRRRDRFDYVAEVPAGLTAPAGDGPATVGAYVRARRPLTAADVTVYRIDNRTGHTCTVHTPAGGAR